jgi:hypothetical protein
MQFQVELNFSKKDLERLLTASLSRWGGARLDSVTVNADDNGRTSGYAFLRNGSKTTTINFSHDVIVAGICQASAAAGTPIAADTLQFTYHRGHGHGGGSTTTATAKSGTAADVAACAEAAAGRITFPGTVTVYFGIDELPELVKSAVKRAGQEPTYCTVSYDKDNGTSASVSVKVGATSGSIKLSPAELNQTITDELTARGYNVVPDGYTYSYSQGGFGSRSGTSVTVTLLGLPTNV